MRSIWKYSLEITDEQRITMPKNAKIFSAQTQNGILCVWALVDTKEEMAEVRTFIIHDTGRPVCDDNLEFIATFQLKGGAAVFHLFERK